MMGANIYKEIINSIQNHQNIRDCQAMLEEKFPMISTMTLGSILGNFVQKKMKANHSRHNTQSKIQEYYKRYKESVSARDAPGIILRLADGIQICPVLVARFILEAYLREHQEKELEKYQAGSRARKTNTDATDKESNDSHITDKSSNTSADDETATAATPAPSSSAAKSTTPASASGAAPLSATAAASTSAASLPNYSTNLSILRQEVSRLLRDTTLIEDRDLSYEVYLCTVHDDQYGPIPDAIKQSIGTEYEEILKEKLSNLGVWFVDESILRKQGYDKTPDFKLEVPIAIGGRVVNWIESKATFGDEETHQTYLEEQLMSYWNRYGPGLVIYWLGYVDTLESKTKADIQISDQLPTNITYLNNSNNSNGRRRSSGSDNSEEQDVDGCGDGGEGAEAETEAAAKQCSQSQQTPAADSPSSPVKALRFS